MARLGNVIRGCYYKHDGVKKVIIGHWLKAEQKERKERHWEIGGKNNQWRMEGGKQGEAVVCEEKGKGKQAEQFNIKERNSNLTGKLMKTRGPRAAVSDRITECADPLKVQKVGNEMTVGSVQDVVQ